MSTVKGNLEKVSEDGFITGWALDEINTSEPLQLTLTVDGQPAGSFLCSQSRPDLLEAGFSTQIAGFSYTVPPAFLDGETHQIAFLNTSTGEAVLSECERSAFFTKYSPGFVKLEGRETLTGEIKQYGFGKRRLIMVEILVDGRSLTVLTLRPPSQADGCVPFSVKLPPSVAESRKAHEIAVKLLGTDDHLTGSPLLSATSDLVGAFDQLVGTHITGWAHDLTFGGTQVLDVFCDDEFVMQVRCDVVRKDIQKALGISAAGFSAMLPIAAVTPASRNVHLQFSDGRMISGGPKFFQPMDIELIKLERMVFAEISEDGGGPPFEKEISQIGMILAAPFEAANAAQYRKRAIELAYEVLPRVLFSCSPTDAAQVLVKLALIGANVFRGNEDLLTTLPILQKLPPNSPLALGLIDLERQRRRPLSRLMLAGLLLAHDRAEEGVDMIFDTFWSTAENDRDGLAQLGASMMTRAGHASSAQEIIFASLMK